MNWVKKEISEKADNRKKDDGFFFAILVDVTNIMFKFSMKYEFIEKTIITDISSKYIKEVIFIIISITLFRKKSLTLYLNMSRIVRRNDIT